MTINKLYQKPPAKTNIVVGGTSLAGDLGGKDARWVKRQIKKRYANYKNREVYPISITTGDPICDIMCKAFTAGFGGKMVTAKKWQKLKKLGIKLDNIMAYGILRGIGPIMQQVPNYFYIDHGYFNKSKNKKQAFSGYYRICHNSMWHDGSGDYPPDRFNNLNINMRKWRKHGNHVIIIPPNKPIARHLENTNWLNDTILKLRKHTDRKLIISRKSNLPSINPPLMSKYEQNIEKMPLNLATKNAWAVVTDHSNAAIESIINGMPAIITNPQRKLGDIKDIEDPPTDRDFLKNLAYQQWTIEEIISGKPKEHFPILDIIQQ